MEKTGDREADVSTVISAGSVDIPVSTVAPGLPKESLAELPHGLPQGVVQKSAQGLPQRSPQGVPQVLSQGSAQTLPQDSSQGLLQAPSEESSRGVTRGVAQGPSQDPLQGPPQGAPPQGIQLPGLLQRRFASQPGSDSEGTMAPAIQDQTSPAPAAATPSTDGAMSAAVPLISGITTANAAIVAAQSTGETFTPATGSITRVASSNKGNLSQPAYKVAQKDTGEAAGTRNSEAASSPESTKSKATEAPGGASSQNGQSNGQSAQHSEVTASQAPTAKNADSGAAEAQLVPAGVEAHSSPTPNDVRDRSHQVMHPTDPGSSPLDGDEATTVSGVNAAKLIQTMGETEMRVGLHSTEFGNISIRASVSQQQLLAQISLDHGGLGQAISAHVASVETKLGNDSGLRTLIEVNQQGASSSGDSGSSPQREQSAFVRTVRDDSTPVPAELDIGMSSEAPGTGVLAIAGNEYRLDIRA